ncbi:hypothetical protein SNE40_010846 [Patella caerulea]|uniref:Uncharacterized protein n=1 Tax=Patella caerulea TaxID=87958 RepID=A0AAN8JST5_PATCE
MSVYPIDDKDCKELLLVIMQVLPLVLVLCFIALVSSVSLPPSDDVESLQSGTKIVKRSPIQCSYNGKTYNVGDKIDSNGCFQDCSCVDTPLNAVVQCKKRTC